MSRNAGTYRRAMFSVKCSVLGLSISFHSVDIPWSESDPYRLRAVIIQTVLLKMTLKLGVMKQIRKNGLLLKGAGRKSTLNELLGRYLR